MKYDYSQETANEFLEQSDLDIEVLEAKLAAQAAELECYETARQEDAKRIDAQAATIAQLREVATAAREYIKVATFREANNLCYHCGADETMQHSKLCYYEQTRNKLAAALAALEQETK